MARLPLDEGGQLEQVAHPEGAATTGQLYERVTWRAIGPGGGQQAQLALLVMEPDAILAPVLLVTDELELAPTQRVERMRYPNT